ncbi:D-alanyl-D-alanine carboxypeptidase family protein [Sulfuriferula thiophila]|uniref:D-alanyl-D-alanine carboxypeptidase family protein n=1 Tax=Sulfuriferula thiophila TaxID=1781211 RepID=UPI000F60C03F|nr:D-alanyl-D-alanine carboxypeptidase family protein [Sulfuriferula thiophila]
MQLSLLSRVAGALLLGLVLEGSAAAVPLAVIPDAPDVDARNYVLVDPASGQVLAAREAEQKVPPASLTKLMTAYLTMQALAQGRLKLDQVVPVSVAAWKAGGSTMFLQPGLPATVEQMLQGMVVVSGNDAAVALAEAIAGNTESFVQMMNMTAAQLGMTQTHFDNVNGLPTPTHLLSAHDIAILTENIIRQYPQYLHYFGEKSFTYNKVTQANWNPLVFTDATVTGMKTGHTEEAGYCLDATATREGRHLLAVVLGSSTRTGSAKAAEALLNYGYSFFETRRAYVAGQVISTVRNNQASPARITIGSLSDVWVTVPRGRYSQMQVSVSLLPQMSLPLKRGQQLGTLVMRADGKEFARVPLVSLQVVEKAGWFGHIWNVILAKF